MENIRKKIVIADDEEDILSALKETLSETYTIFTAENGKDALDLIKKVDPDLVIMDILMPVMDGFEACRRIKASKITLSIPVLMLTAKGQMEDTLKGFSCGADSYMVKPFSPEKLLEKISQLIEKAEMRKEMQ